MKKLLFIILVSSLAVSAVAAPEPLELENRGIEAMAAGDYARAEEIFRDLIELRPESFVGHYNLGAALSMRGEADASIKAMSTALALGFTDKAQLLRDPDLETFRGTDFFGQLMSQWGELIEARRQGDLDTVRPLIKETLESRTDEDLRLELLSAHDETATDQAHAELSMLADWAVGEVFTGLADHPLDDLPWIMVVLPDRTGFMSWAVTVFGPGVQGSISSVGGAYEHQQRRLVAQDLGATLRHEFIHVLHWRDMNRLGQAHAPWVQEGLASLVEDYDTEGDDPVPVPSWRTNIVKRMLDVHRLPRIEELAVIEMQSFTAKRPLAQYAQARTIMLYLLERGLLDDFYARYTANYDDDPSGYDSLLAVLDYEPEELEQAYRAWIAELVTVAETGSDLTATLGIEIENGTDGVAVTGLPGNARSRTGLRLGSVITHIEGRPTRDLFEFIRVLGQYGPGDTVTLHHRRGRVHSSSEVELLAR
ncbi:MAG: PDZ domain-containing protein [Phycisphaerales bacterium]